MQRQSDKKLNRYAFDSLRELGDFIKDTPRKWKANNSRTNTPEMSWDLNAGYEESLRLSRQGWIEGAQTVQASLKSLSARQPAPRERNDFYGYRPNVPRYCAGAPDCMVRHEGDTGAGKSLSIVVDICVSGATSARAMSLYGVAVAHYIKQQELEGTRCEVRVAATVTLRGVRETCSVLVKRAGQPLDLAVLAYAIGHPAFFRRLWFAFTERAGSPEEVGYGSISPVNLVDVLGAPSSSVVLYGMNNCTFRTPEQALEALAQEINSKQKE
jgi:hypothetical protein